MRRKGEGPGWSRTAFLSSLAAALFGALYLANDTFIMHEVIVFPEDPFTATSFYLITGSWIGVACMALYNKIFGKRIDKDYPGFNFGTRKMQLFALISGGIAAASTTFCLIGNQKLDPSLVIGLSTISIFYMGLYETRKKYVKLKNIVLPEILVVIGAILTNLSAGLQIAFIGILILLIGRCGTDAAEQIVRQEGVWNSDAITFNFWRFLWLSITGTILIFTTAVIRGKINELNELLAMRKLFFNALPWILLTMFFVFFYNALTQKAMKTGAVSKISVVLSSRVTLGIPIALIGNKVCPGIFGKIPSDPWVWIVRSIGIGLITSGVAFLEQKERERRRREEMGKKQQ